MSESALTSRLKAARRAVGDSGREQRVIGTVHGRGYRFLAPVQLRGAEPREAGLEAAPAPIGREAELALLGELHRLADGGRRQVVFVTGEAGIGKTTLVDAFAGATAGRVARGQCLEQRGAPEPYLPVFDALDRLCRDDAEALGWLCRLAPTWLAQMPALVGEADREELERRARGGTPLRMLREAAEALEAIGAERPLALVLEDLHWADPSTVDLLDWLARRDTPARLLLVGTYRPADALAGGAPIAGVTAELRLHAAVAQRLERAYGPDAPERAAELASQFLGGHDHPRAVGYLQAAAAQALGRSAHREAIQQLELLLATLPRLPEGANRDRAELTAQIMLGPALIATRGFASPEVEAAYTRARDLAEALGLRRELALVLHGLAAVNEFRGRYHRSERC